VAGAASSTTAPAIPPVTYAAQYAPTAHIRYTTQALIGSAPDDLTSAHTYRR